MNSVPTGVARQVLVVVCDLNLQKVGMLGRESPYVHPELERLMLAINLFKEASRAEHPFSEVVFIGQDINHTVRHREHFLESTEGCVSGQQYTVMMTPYSKARSVFDTTVRTVFPRFIMRELPEKPVEVCELVEVSVVMPAEMAEKYYGLWQSLESRGAYLGVSTRLHIHAVREPAISFWEQVQEFFGFWEESHTNLVRGHTIHFYRPSIKEEVRARAASGWEW